MLLFFVVVQGDTLADQFLAYLRGIDATCIFLAQGFTVFDVGGAVVGPAVTCPAL